MTPNEIRALSSAEINKQIEFAKEELFNLRFQKASGQLENVTRVNIVRRQVARLRTILREQELAAEVLEKEQSNA